jgi:hypothetical protein
MPGGAVVKELQIPDVVVTAGKRSGSVVADDVKRCLWWANDSGEWRSSLFALRAVVAAILGGIPRFIEVGGGGVVLDKETPGCGGSVIEGVLKGGGDVSHIGVYISCHRFFLGGDGHVHFVHTIAKHAECANIFAKWTR